MAKRYRYAFAKKREAQQGKLSAVLAAVSLVLFVTAVLLAFFLIEETNRKETNCKCRRIVSVRYRRI